MGIQSVAARVGKTPPQWLLEGLFIIVSVALGFGVAQYGEHRNNRELATRVLKNLQAELKHSLTILGPMVPIHRKLSGGALRLIDYDVVAALSEIYRLQEIATDNVDRLAKGGLSSTATFDPASRVASVRLLWLTLADIESAESALLDLYQQHLPATRAAANAER